MFSESVISTGCRVTGKCIFLSFLLPVLTLQEKEVGELTELTRLLPVIARKSMHFVESHLFVINVTGEKVTEALMVLYSTHSKKQKQKNRQFYDNVCGGSTT